MYPEEKQGGCRKWAQKSLRGPLSAQRHTLVVRGDWARHVSAGGLFLCLRKHTTERVRPLRSE